MQNKIIDANVPLTAGGYNHVASYQCQSTCIELLRRILRGDVIIIIDDEDEVLREYANKARPDPSGNPAEQFLMYVLTNRYDESRIRRLGLARNDKGQFEEFPDNGDAWRADILSCERFDPDDKKWVALAVRFKKDAGTDAPIVNAADRCWLAFEPHLKSAGVKLEILCRDDRQQYG